MKQGEGEQRELGGDPGMTLGRPSKSGTANAGSTVRRSMYLCTRSHLISILVFRCPSLSTVLPPGSRSTRLSVRPAWLCMRRAIPAAPHGAACGDFARLGLTRLVMARYGTTWHDLARLGSSEHPRARGPGPAGEAALGRGRGPEWGPRLGPALAASLAFLAPPPLPSPLPD